MSQNRKRNHEAANAGEAGGKIGSGELNASSADSSPMSKRTLLNNQQISNIKSAAAAGQRLQSNANQTRLTAKAPQKSMRPTQSINLLNAPEEIYYVANRNLK